MSDIHLDTRGEGADVVLVHGLPQFPDDLEPLASSLASHFRTHLVHLPGYGRSAARELNSIDATHALLEEALVAAGVTAAAYVGMSGGFYRVLRLVLDGQKCRPWALVGLGAIAGLSGEDREIFRAAAAAVLAGTDLGPLLIARLLSPSFAESHPTAAAHVARTGLAAPGTTIAAELAAFADAPDLRARLHEVECPVYLRTGELDIPTPPTHAATIAAGLRDARLEIVDGAGHLLLLEDRSATLESVRLALDAALRVADRRIA